MAGVRELKGQIKWALNNLSADNAQHDFESICRHFARKRIGINVLPATGPVAAKGDQGRDFESYEVIVEGEGLVSDKISFACTVQQTDLAGKIKEDVKKTQTKGQPADIIYFFSLVDIPVGSRHEYIKWAHDEFKVKLEIIDGEALSEDLCSNDLFWIAEEYLHIPSTLLPAVEDEEYLELRGKWGKLEPTRPSHSDLYELTSIGRRCLFDTKLKQHLPFWLEKLATFSQIEGLSSKLKRKALYELIALRMRGMRDLKGWEKYAFEYFEAEKGYNNPNEARDAVVVSTYTLGALVRGAADFEKGKLREWRESIDKYVDELLETNPSVATKATLYEIKGSIILSDPESSSDDVERGIEWWIELADVIEDSPLFPLESFSNVLTMMVVYIGDYPSFSTLVEKIDSLLEKRVGGFAVAEKCRDRAIQYKENGDLIKTLQEFHKAKINWFAKETMYGSLLAMLVIADTYSELGLVYAAKYYAMVVVYTAVHYEDDKIKPFVTRGFEMLAEIDYLNGEWANFLNHAFFTLASIGHFSPDLDNDISEGNYMKMLFYSGNVSALSEQVIEDKKIHSYVDSEIRKWNLDELNDDVIPMAKESWGSRNTAETMSRVESGFLGFPFNDLLSDRECRWTASGISWTFKWGNGFSETLVAGYLISIVQIILADIADKDMYFLRADALVKVNLGEGFGIEREQSNDETIWSVTIPNILPEDRDHIDEFHRNVSALAIAMLTELSLLPDQAITEEIESLLKSGITQKAFVGSSYDVVYREANSEDFYGDLPVLNRTEEMDKFRSKKPINENLLWNGGLIGEYDDAEELDKIKRRYERAIIPVKKTLESLNQDPAFKAVVRKLRSEGWKDWHILTSVAQVAVNYRVNTFRFSNPDKLSKPEEIRDMFFEEMEKEESEGSLSVPLTQFSEKAIRTSLFMTSVPILSGLGLDVRTNTPNKKALFDFMGNRMKFWENDIDHDEIFLVD